MGGRKTAGEPNRARRGSGPSRGEIEQLKAEERLAEASMDTGLSAFSLSIAKVLFVDYETLSCNIEILTGTREEPIKNGVPLTFPGAGRRHFLGAMPCIGDFCLVGWSSGNSTGHINSRLPRIISYFPAPWWMGRDWVPAQDFSPEFVPGGGSNLGVNTQLEGRVDRVRFKARHIEPGNVVASSAQGSDLALDESVTLANRRGNELVLREQDQALVVRSINQFHAMSGARVYAGLVQRDAKYLPTEMFSDGYWWDHGALEGEPSIAFEMNNPTPAGGLTPSQLFSRTYVDGEMPNRADFYEGRSEGMDHSPHLDPFTFLAWGAFIGGPDGQRADLGGDAGGLDEHDKMAIQGGKAYYRVATVPFTPGVPVRGIDNGAFPVSDDETPPTLSEYRIEVSHTSDGLLPVTEQTDGFEAERLPTSASGALNNAPFVEVVYGSVVGNDPFGDPDMYGLPLVPTISPTPTLGSGVGKPLEDHAATLFKVRSIVGGPDTWVATNKRGKVFANLANGLDINFGGQGTTSEIGAGGSVNLSSPGQVAISGRGSQGARSWGVDINSSDNAVRIFGGAMSSEGQSAGGQEETPDSENSPSVLVHGQQNVVLRAGQRVQINAPVLDLSNIQTLEMNSQNRISLTAGSAVDSSGEVVSQASSKSMSISNSGGNPLDGVPYDHTLTCNPATFHIPMTTVHRTTMPTGGGREFLSTMGNDMSTLVVGNSIYNTLTGMCTQASLAGVNQTTIGPAGYTSSVGAGAYTATALAGPMSMMSSVSSVFGSMGGPTNLRSSSTLIMSSPGIPGIGYHGGCLDPLFGVPVMTLTMCDPGIVRSPA